MDTDSAYIVFSSENLNDIVKPELQEHFQKNKHCWLCRTDTEEEMLIKIHQVYLRKSFK
jgi:hypothetical protein